MKLRVNMTRGVLGIKKQSCKWVEMLVRTPKRPESECDLSTDNQARKLRLLV